MYKIIRQNKVHNGKPVALRSAKGEFEPDSTFDGRALGMRFDRGIAHAERLNRTHLYHLHRWGDRYLVMKGDGGSFEPVDLSEELRNLAAEEEGTSEEVAEEKSAPKSTTKDEEPAEPKAEEKSTTKSTTKSK